MVRELRWGLGEDSRRMVCCTKFMWELGDQLLFGEHVMPIGEIKKTKKVEQMMETLKTCTHAKVL